MPKKKNKFIEKKDAITFSLVRRSQLDPLAHDPSASKYVLQPTYVPKKQDPAKIPKIPADIIFDSQVYSRGLVAEAAKSRKDFRDAMTRESEALVHDYDYSQHLKSIDDGEFVAAEGVDPGLGHLHTARQQDRAEDPELVAALQALQGTMGEDASAVAFGKKDFPLAVRNTKDFLEALEGGDDLGERFQEIQDDFVAVALQGDLVSDDDAEGGEEDPFETKTPAGGYIGGLELEEEEAEARAAEEEAEAEAADPDAPEPGELDRQFEALMDDYEDEELGELEEDPRTMGTVEDVVAEYAGVLDKQLSTSKERYEGLPKAAEAKDKDTLDAKTAALQIDRLIKATPEEDMQSVYTAIDTRFRKPVREKWDAESIISTYSNLENHPTIIKRPSKASSRKIKLSAKGVPIGVLVTPAMRKQREAAEEEEEELVVINEGKKRSKTETKEERKARKKAIKAQRRLQRQQKKGLKEAFKHEAGHQAKTKLGQDKANFAHVKL